MSSDNEFKNLIKNVIKPDSSPSEILDTPKTENETKVKKSKKGESVKGLKKSNSKLALAKSDYAKVTPALLDVDPNEIEKLLHGKN